MFNLFDKYYLTGGHRLLIFTTLSWGSFTLFTCVRWGSWEKESLFET